MFLTKLKITAAVLLVVAVVGLGAAGLYRGAGRATTRRTRTAGACPVPCRSRRVGEGTGPGEETRQPFQSARQRHAGRGPLAGRQDSGQGGYGSNDGSNGGLVGRRLRQETAHAEGPDRPHLQGGVFAGRQDPGFEHAEPCGADDMRVEMKLWDVATGKERVLVKGHRKSICSMAFSPDGKTLATSTADQEADPACREIVGCGDREGEDGTRRRRLVLAPSPSRRTAKPWRSSVGGSWKKPGSVQLWDLTTGKKRASMPGHGSWDWSLGFTPDGKTLVSAGFRTNEAKGKRGHLLSSRCGTLPRPRSGPPSPSPNISPRNRFPLGVHGGRQDLDYGSMDL